MSLGDTTAYTSGWLSNSCNPIAISVVYVSPGTNTLPATLLANTVYVLSSGSYMMNYRYNGISNIINGNCTAVVGVGDVTLYTSRYNTDVLYSTSKAYTVIDNIKIDGASNGISYKGTRNSRGIYFNSSSNNTIRNIESFNTQSNGVNINGTYNKALNITTYNNTSNGFALIGNYSTTDSVISYGNGAGGYYLNGSYNTIKNTIVYNNATYGVYINTASYNTFERLTSYNNYSFGIYFQSSACINNTINNAQVFNNSDAGIYIETLNIQKTSINNSAFFNNSSHGIYINNSSGTILNNIISYNNSNYGIYFANTNY